MLRESKTGKSAVSELKDAKWNSLEKVQVDQKVHYEK